MRHLRISSRRLVPFVAALCTLALIVGLAAMVSHRRAADHRPSIGAKPSRVPPTLRLVGLAGDPARGAPPRDDTVDPVPGMSGLRLDAALPRAPAEAAAYRLLPARATAAEVTRVARALGLAGEPRRTGPGWVVTSAAARLVVSDGSSLLWTYGTASAGCLPPLPSESSVGVASCISQGSTPPRQASAAAAKAAAVLRRLGIPTGSLRRSANTFIAPGSLAGRPVSGWDTTVTLDQNTGLINATGYLARPELLAAYPVISAAEAYRRLRTLPRMLPLTATRCLLIAGSRGCGTPRPVTITKVRLGLQLETDTRLGALLVPAWLFMVGTGQGEQTDGALGVVAVADRYLDQVSAEPPSDAPAPPEGGSGPGAEPTSPAGPGPVPGPLRS